MPPGIVKAPIFGEKQVKLELYRSRKIGMMNRFHRAGVVFAAEDLPDMKPFD
jgi:hypothetical protein